MNYQGMSISIKILILTILLCFSSCKVFQSTAYKHNNPKSREEMLTRLLNDTTTCNISELEIINTNLYSLIDSVVSWHYDCEFSEDLIPNTYCFVIEYSKERNEFSLLLTEFSIVNFVNPNLSGGFYFRNNLFVFSSNIESFPDRARYLKDTGCSLRIPFCNSWDVPSYYFYLRFKIIDTSYRITYSNICKEEVII